MFNIFIITRFLATFLSGLLIMSSLNRVIYIHLHNKSIESIINDLYLTNVSSIIKGLDQTTAWSLLVGIVLAIIPVVATSEKFSTNSQSEHPLSLDDYSIEKTDNGYLAWSIVMTPLVLKGLPETFLAYSFVLILLSGVLWIISKQKDVYMLDVVSLIRGYSLYKLTWSNSQTKCTPDESVIFVIAKSNLILLAKDSNLKAVFNTFPILKFNSVNHAYYKESYAKNTH